MRLHPGEIEASGWRVEGLPDVVQRLLDASPGVVGRPRVIAIDGRGGAGKSTLVERLRLLVPRSRSCTPTTSRGTRPSSTGGTS
jgi:AAA15 family ATPase/GTPase